MKTPRCLDCKTDTYEIGEYYMVHHDLWETANPKIKGMLCIGCLERRLGRELDYTDFTWSPLNLGNLFIGSDRLRARMDASGMLVHGLAELETGTIAWGIIEAVMATPKNRAGGRAAR